MLHLKHSLIGSHSLAYIDMSLLPYLGYADICSQLPRKINSLYLCGPVYQRLSTEISGPAWCESSSKGKKVWVERGGRSCHITSAAAVSSIFFSAMPSRLLSYSTPFCIESSRVRLGWPKNAVELHVALQESRLLPSVTALRTEGLDNGVILEHL